MPVSISHIYNANDSGENEFGLGNGWRTNFHQKVYHWDHVNATADYYVWEDADGTAHYFLKYEDKVYKDEDGLELTLEVLDVGGYTIEDKYGNISTFDSSGRLTKQENNQQTKSSIQVTYSTSNPSQISKVTDGAGRVYTFTYNSSGLLNKIAYKGSGNSELSYVTFSYSGTKLTSITDKDGKTSTYTYTTSTNDATKVLLATATDIDGYKLTYTYDAIVAGEPARVRSVEEHSGTTAGGKLSFTYANNQTTVTDHNQNVQLMQFNNWGNTVSVQDGEGRGQFCHYNVVEKKDENDEIKRRRANQLSLSSKLQNTVSNLLSDSSFESSTLWNAAGSATRGIVSGTAYLGGKSLKVTTTAANAGVSSGTVSTVAEKSYTFSAWVKTGTAKAHLALYSGSTLVASSEVLAANTDWTRLEVSYTPTAAGSLTARLVTDTAGIAYLDCVQLEQAVTASRYNLLQNGDFRDTSAWSASAGRANAGSVATPTLDTNAYQLTGSPTTTNRLSQTVQVSGEGGETFVLAGWAKGDSVPLRTTAEERKFALVATFLNGSTAVGNPIVVSFNPDTNSTVQWQYAAGALVAPDTYTAVKVELAYDYNYNAVLFDGIQLFKEEFGSSYKYDENGNLVVVRDINGQETINVYNHLNELIAVDLPITPRGEELTVDLTYTYDDHHNVKTATTESGIAYSYDYDAYGNNTKVSMTSGGVTLSSSAAYTTDGNRLSTTTDAAGKVTRYSYNANTNVLEWVQYPEDTASTRTNYTYDSMYRLASAAATTNTGSALTASYTYTNDLLSSITTGSSTYNFTYGAFGLRTKVSVGSRKLAEYSYTSRNNYLEKLDYDNDGYVQYTYDNQGRVLSQTYEDGDTVTYKYDNSGALASVTDSATGITTTYYYDFTDRLMKYVEKSSTGSHSVGYEYDSINNLTALVETINGVTQSTSYAYDQDNRVTSVTNGSASESYSYDGFSRVTQRQTNHGTTGVLTEKYTYRTPATGTTSGQVSKLTLDAASYDAVYNYTYDDNGNILSVSAGGKTTSYVYDTANQLTRENNQAAGKTWVWTYDDAGNILSRKEYAYTTGTPGTAVDTVNYAYGNADWGDLLTSWDGKALSYDNIGNLTNDQEWTYTWEHGRELASMSKSGTAWTFTYNADGLRTGRTNGTTTYTYVYNGSALSYMSKGSDKLYFAYDASGSPMAVTYNNTTYYYATNIQGDVVAILNASGAAVVTYTYDAWGNILTTGGSMASTLGTVNPLRYRGYVYDTETGLYYVSSRYYDPEIGRWINADNQLSTGDMTGMNLFAYCGNNPVNRIDPTGEAWWHWALGAAVVAACAVATVVTCGGFAAAATAVCMVGSGVAAATTASTVAAAAFIGSATVYGTAVLAAASSSSSIEEFNAQGNWGTVAATAGGAVFNGAAAYAATRTPTTTVYRSVSNAEAQDIKNTGQFNLAPGGMESKQFGFNLSETRQFGNMMGQNTIVSAKVPNSMLNQLYTGGVDTSIFRAGTLTVYGDQLGAFNQAVSGTIKFMP